MTHVLRHRDFRFLWMGQSLSTVGDRLVTVALALLVIDRTGSPTDLGLVLAAHSIPLVAFLLVGGVWADRLPRNRVMIVSDLTRFALHTLLAVLIFTDAVQIWHLIVIEALFGTAEAFFRPSFSGLVPQTVPEEEVQRANALNGVSSTVAEFAGPALATALVLGIGAGFAFALDAATFLLSAWCLLQVRPRARGEAAEQTRMLTELREGWSAVRERAWVWATILAFSGALLLSLAPSFVLGTVIAEEEYGSTGVYGVVLACFGLGTIAGSLAASRWRPRYPMRLALLCALPWPPSIALFALGLPLWIVLPALVIGGTGVALFDVWWISALAERIPPHLLSRVSAYDWMGSLGLVPLGYLLAGPAGEWLGAQEVLFGGSLLATLCLALALLPRATRMLERGAAPEPWAPTLDPRPVVPAR
jgi:MFS family permease